MLRHISEVVFYQTAAAFRQSTAKTANSYDLCISTVAQAGEASDPVSYLVDCRFGFREHNQSAVASADIITHESCTPLGEK
jgi:hypothetical protein